MLHEQGGRLGHPPAHAGGADAAALAGKGDPKAVAAALALGDEEAVFEVAAGKQRVELVRNERRQAARALFEAVAKRRPVFPHQGQCVAVLGAARDVLRCSVTAGHPRRWCAWRAARSSESFQALGRRSGGQAHAESKRRTGEYTEQQFRCGVPERSGSRQRGSPGVMISACENPAARAGGHVTPSVPAPLPWRGAPFSSERNREIGDYHAR